MLKKILCTLAGVVAALIELMILGVAPLSAIPAMILPVGFVALAMAIYSDYQADKTISTLGIIKYSCAFVCIALVGAGVKLNTVVLLIIGAIFAVGAVIVHCIETKKFAKFSKKTTEEK